MIVGDADGTAVVGAAGEQPRTDIYGVPGGVTIAGIGIRPDVRVKRSGRRR